MIRAWIFRTIGNIFYHFNGGLEGVGKDTKLAKIMTWAWSNSYFLEEKAAGRLPDRL